MCVCVCVCSLSYPACNTHAPYCHLWPVCIYRVFHKFVKHVRKVADATVEGSNDYIFQQDGSPAHYKDVRGYLNRNLPQRWIGRTGKDDALTRWPPRYPDLNPCDFFFWGDL